MNINHIIFLSSCEDGIRKYKNIYFTSHESEGGFTKILFQLGKPPVTKKVSYLVRKYKYFGTYSETLLYEYLHPTLAHLGTRKYALKTDVRKKVPCSYLH